MCSHRGEHEQTLNPQCPGPPLHARLAVGLDEQLHLGFGRDLGADIATIEHGAARLQGEAPLQLEQRLPDIWNGGDL